MAVVLFLHEGRCPICGEPRAGGQALIGFTFVASTHPLVRPLDDGGCHCDCLNQWEHRDEFVRAWNREAMYALGPLWFLEVTPSGQVRYLTWLGRLLYRWGRKRSPLLPESIRRDRPLLKLQLTNGCRSPLWVHKQYGYLHSHPPPEAIGLTPDSAAAVRAWTERFAHLCNQSRIGHKPPVEEWDWFGPEGLRLWELLKKELGHRYRIVYLTPGHIFEPETLD